MKKKKIRIRVVGENNVYEHSERKKTPERLHILGRFVRPPFRIVGH